MDLLNENANVSDSPTLTMTAAGSETAAGRRTPAKDHRNKAPVQKQMARHGLLQHDSGNEESDSLHSLYHC